MEPVTVLSIIYSIPLIYGAHAFLAIIRDRRQYDRLMGRLQEQFETGQ